MARYSPSSGKPLPLETAAHAISDGAQRRHKEDRAAILEWHEVCKYPFNTACLRTFSVGIPAENYYAMEHAE
jgi:hypothetical protein